MTGPNIPAMVLEVYRLRLGWFASVFTQRSSFGFKLRYA